MKKILLTLCMLCNAMTMQCMNLDLLQDIDCEAIDTSFTNIHQDHIKSFIEEYKKTDGSPENIDKILTMSASITGHQNSEYIHSVKDDQGNTILKVAIQKIDFPTVRWLIEQGNTKYHTHQDCYDYVNLSVKQLSSAANDTTRITAYNILKTIVEPYKTRNMDKEWRKYFIKEMISLRIQHKKEQIDFTIEEELLTPFLKQNPEDTKTVIKLSDIYQNTVDAEKNSLTHIIVNLGDINALEQLIGKDYVSPLKNQENFDALELATKNLRRFSQQTSLLDTEPTEFNNRRCIYFVLLNYFLLKRKEKLADCFCCPKHIEMLKAKELS